MEKEGVYSRSLSNHQQSNHISPSLLTNIIQSGVQTVELEKQPLPTV